MAEQWKKIASGERLQDSLACKGSNTLCVCVFSLERLMFMQHLAFEGSSTLNISLQGSRLFIY